LIATLVASALAHPAAAQAPRPELDRLRAEREQIGGRLDQVTGELEQLTVAITDAQAQREQLEREVANLQRVASNAQQLLTAQAVSAYMNGDFGPVGHLMTAAQPGQALERSRMLAGLGLRERELTEKASIARATLATRRSELDRVLATLRGSEQRAAGLRAELDRAFADAKSREQAVASLTERQRLLTRAGQHGVYACPIARPFHFRDTWGAPRSGGRRHKGVDMFAPHGVEVYAITKGVVLRHSRSGLGGIGLYIRGEDGNVYYYAHLASIVPAYRPGKRVNAGELVAYNGDTGNARGGAPHVHFEVHPGGGGPVNPYPYTAAACF
jgi:murein DD-endopeptidase MepM/ murein hydrolase activator NlpD